MLNRENLVYVSVKDGVVKPGTGVTSHSVAAVTKTVAVPVYTEHSMTVTEFASVEIRATLPAASSGSDKCKLTFLIKMRHTNATSGRTNMTGVVTANIAGTDYTILDTAASGPRPVYLNTADNYIEDNEQNNWTYELTDIPFDTKNRSLSVYVRGSNIKTDALSDLSINFEQNIYLEETMT